MQSATQSPFDQENSLSLVILKAASLLLFIVVGIYSNGRVIYKVLVADVQRPVLNVFVASLSIADLATCVAIMPFILVSLICGEWVFSRIFCTVHNMLVVYLVHVEVLSTCAIVYDRYRAIYRKRFTSLSHRQVTILLCMVWIFPMLLVAPMARPARQQLSYLKQSGMCLNTYENNKTWNVVFLVKRIVSTSLGLLFILFSFWKILAFIIPIRRRVSPGLLSNEEKLTVAAHARSAWTTIIFVLTYMILALPLFVTHLVNEQRKNSGKGAIAEDVICAFLWLYWLQCAIKPIVYVSRSERCICRACDCLSGVEDITGTSRCFGCRNRARAYEVSESGSENNRSSVSAGRFPTLPRGEFLELCQIPVKQPTDPTESPKVSRRMQDFLPATNDFSNHSLVIIEEELIMKSCVDQDDKETNCCHGDANVIPADDCYEAVELENIERMFDEALRAQEREWSQKCFK